MEILELCAGIGAFSLASQRVNQQLGNDFYSTVACSEIEPFCNKVLLREDHEIIGDLGLVATSRENHVHQSLMDEDIVPVEETNFTSLCIEDFLEGIVNCDIITVGSPCQNISPANTTTNNGIDGEKSKVIYDVLRITQDLEPMYLIIENSDKLLGKGLDVILSTLNEMEYDAQWSIISGANFGFNQYRHRCFVIAYLRDTVLAKSGKQFFKSVSEQAVYRPGEIVPLLKDMSEEQKLFTKVDEPKSINLRTKRVNALGNSIIVDVAQAIMYSLASIELGNGSSERLKEEWVGNCSEAGTVDLSGDRLIKIPSSGMMIDGRLIKVDPDRKLNPSKSEFKNMAGSLLKKDGNNNFSCESRLTRPGTFGGHVGSIMHAFGYNEGAINPLYCEKAMGFPVNYTCADKFDKKRMLTPIGG
jgi:DNA (cytosine-5)-methyltransferase 1